MTPSSTALARTPCLEVFDGGLGKVELASAVGTKIYDELIGLPLSLEVGEMPARRLSQAEGTLYFDISFADGKRGFLIKGTKIITPGSEAKTLDTRFVFTMDFGASKTLSISLSGAEVDLFRSDPVRHLLKLAGEEGLMYGQVRSLAAKEYDGIVAYYKHIAKIGKRVNHISRD